MRRGNFARQIQNESNFTIKNNIWDNHDHTIQSDALALRKAISPNQLVRGGSLRKNSIRSKLGEHNDTIKRIQKQIDTKQQRKN